MLVVSTNELTQVHKGGLHLQLIRHAVIRYV